MHVASGQIISTAAGDTSWRSIEDVVSDQQGNLYITDYAARKIYKVDRLGAAITIAGTGVSGIDGDGGPATSATLTLPMGIALGPDGSVYFSDYGGYKIRRISPNGIITNVAGTGTAGFAGDGGPAVAARIGRVLDLVVDGAGNILFSDSTANRIRRISASGVMSTFAGTGTNAFAGDGGPPLLASVVPSSLALGADGTLYFAHSGDSEPRLRAISPAGIVRTIAGTGVREFTGDGGPAVSASFRSINGVAVDKNGVLYVSSSFGARVRRINLAGIVTTFAGTGDDGFSGDGGPALAAWLYGPLDLAFDPNGALLITDSDNKRIRRVSLPLPPSFSSATPTSPSFLGRAAFSSNTYLEIYGKDFSPATRTWSGTDFVNGVAPTTLDGVSVEVNGRPAYIYFISPNQININTPDDTATGPVSLRVSNVNGSTDQVMVTRDRISPTLQSVPQFNVGGKQYVVAQTPDFTTFIGAPGLIPNVNFSPAKPASTVVIYALGCGPTTPASSAGRAATQNAPLSRPYEIRIGNALAQVTFAGITQGTIGLYQFNVVIPNLPAGDYPIDLMIDGIANNQNLFITIGDAR